MLRLATSTIYLDYFQVDSTHFHIDKAEFIAMVIHD